MFFFFSLLYMEKLLSTDSAFDERPYFLGLCSEMGPKIDSHEMNIFACPFHLWPEAAFLSSPARESAARRDLSPSALRERAQQGRQTSRGSEDEDATRRCEVPGGPAVPRAGDEAALAFA